MKLLMTTVAVAAMAFVPTTAQAQLFGGFDNGTLLGGAAGAGLGGVIGSNLAGSGVRDEGTAIGAALGGLAGASYANSRSNFAGNPFAGQFNPGFNGNNLVGAGLGAGLGGVIGSNLAGSGVRQEGTAIGAVLGGAAGYAIANRRQQASRYGNVGPQGGFAPAGAGFGSAGPGFVGAPGFGAPGFGAPGFGVSGFGAPGFGAPALPRAPFVSGPQFVPTGQFISGPIVPVTHYVQPAPRRVIVSQPRTVYTAPVSTGITYAAPNVRLAGLPIRPTVVRRNVVVEAAPIIRAQRVIAEPAACPAGTTTQADGSCLERAVVYSAPVQTYSAPAPVAAPSYAAPQMAECPSGTTKQSDGTCLERSVSYSAPAYTAPTYSSSSTAAAPCPSGTTKQSDGTCLSPTVRSYTPSYTQAAPSTAVVAPAYQATPQYHMADTVVRAESEYCYAGGKKRYDSLGKEIKSDSKDHCSRH